MAAFIRSHVIINCRPNQLYSAARHHQTTGSNKFLWPASTDYYHTQRNDSHVVLDYKPFHFQLNQRRLMSKRPGLIENVIKNVKDGFSKDEKLKESLKSFREETKRMEDSDALKEARRKYDNIEAEGSNIRKSFEDIQKKASDTWKEAQQSEYVQKAGEMGSRVGNVAGKVAEKVQQTGSNISQTDVFKTVSQGVQSVKEELDDAAKVHSRHYFAPSKLKKRQDLSLTTSDSETKVFEADTESTGVIMHKDSRWNQSWQNFKENNQYVHKLFDMKTKYDESDNLMVRMTRSVTDKMGQLFGSMSNTSLSAVLTEICKVDPNFDKEDFIKFCKADIIPNVLEAMVQGDLEVLESWCFEAPFNVAAEPIRQARKAGYQFGSRILDIEHVDVVEGQMMEQGPVLLISFQAQQIMVVYDKAGQVKEGNPDKVYRWHYLWALCRDQECLDPRTAWRVLEVSGQSAEQTL